MQRVYMSGITHLMAIQSVPLPADAIRALLIEDGKGFVHVPGARTLTEAGVPAAEVDSTDVLTYARVIVPGASVIFDVTSGQTHITGTPFTFPSLGDAVDIDQQVDVQGLLVYIRVSGTNVTDVPLAWYDDNFPHTTDGSDLDISPSGNLLSRGTAV